MDSKPEQLTSLTMLHPVRPDVLQKLLKIGFAENYFKKLAQMKDSIKPDYIPVMNFKKSQIRRTKLSNCKKATAS